MHTGDCPHPVGGGGGYIQGSYYLEGLDFGMCSHVDVKDGGASKAFIAEVAGVGSAAGVGAKMLLEVVRPAKL